MLAAMSGAVVSKPTPMKMTWSSGLRAASSTASSGEYTMRTSAPADFSAASDDVLPGTRIMSPRVAIHVPSSRASAMAWSMSRLAVTHTGQPGPESSWRLFGRIERKP